MSLVSRVLQLRRTFPDRTNAVQIPVLLLGDSPGFRIHSTERSLAFFLRHGGTNQRAFI